MCKNRSHVGVAEQWNQKYIFTKIHTKLHTITYTICPSHFLSHTLAALLRQSVATQGLPPIYLAWEYHRAMCCLCVCTFLHSCFTFMCNYWMYYAFFSEHVLKHNVCMNANVIPEYWKIWHKFNCVGGHVYFPWVTLYLWDKVRRRAFVLWCWEGCHYKKAFTRPAWQLQDSS